MTLLEFLESQPVIDGKIVINDPHNQSLIEDQIMRRAAQLTEIGADLSASDGQIRFRGIPVLFSLSGNLEAMAGR